MGISPDPVAGAALRDALSPQRHFCYSENMRGTNIVIGEEQAMAQICLSGAGTVPTAAAAKLIEPQVQAVSRCLTLDNALTLVLKHL